MKNLISTIKTIISLAVLIGTWYVLTSDILVSSETMDIILSVIFGIGGLLVLTFLFLKGKIKFKLKKTILLIIVGLIYLSSVLAWGLISWTICVFLSIYIYKPFAPIWLILSFVGTTYLLKSIIKIKPLKNIVKKFNDFTNSLL